MRRANDSGWVMNEEQLIGINLGADFTSEHEWGIKGIRQAWGGVAGLGIENRIVHHVPTESLSYTEYKTSYNDTMLIFNRRYNDGKDLPLKEVERAFELDIYPSRKLSEGTAVEPKKFGGEDLLACSWDDSSFGIHTQGKKSRVLLKELYTAIKSGDCAIFLSGGGVFQNSGLKVCIASRIPESVKAMWLEADMDAVKLKEASEETGIEKYLQDKMGKKAWFALSPRWANKLEGMQTRTEYPVIYWLNPYEQQRNNYGWFTVEDLMLWAEGKGNIPKTGKKG